MRQATSVVNHLDTAPCLAAEPGHMTLIHVSQSLFFAEVLIDILSGVERVVAQELRYADGHD